MPRISSNATIELPRQGVQIKSPLVSNAVKRQRQGENNDTSNIVQQKRTLDEKRRRIKTVIMSPAQAQSPKAHPSPLLKSPPHSRSLLTIATSNALESSKFSKLPISSASEGSLNSIESSSALTKNLPIEQMSRFFEEWMKMVSDGKINSKNTWSLALIDCFSDLTLLKEGDTINFQKASCTLDGCVKIYSCRVDSVADETGKLLTGLMEDEKVAKTEVENNTADDVVATTKEKKKISASSLVNTIEKNADNLNLKKFETEAPPSVVPIFKKISTLFDENASRSFLLSTIPIGQNGMFSLNFSVNENEPILKDNSFYDLSDFDIDPKSFLLNTNTLIPTIDEILQNESSFSLTSCNELIDKLNEISSNIDDLLHIQELNQSETCDIDAGFGGFETLNSSADNIDMMVVESNNEDIIPAEPFEHNDADDFSHSVSEDLNSEDNADNYNAGTLLGNNQTLSSSMQDMTLEDEVPSIDETQFKGGWAGPQHWKIHRQLSAFSSNSQPKIKRQPKNEASQVKKSHIDFSLTPQVDIDKQFTPPSSISSITTSLSSMQERSSLKNLLPEDFKFTAKKLLSLSTKPYISFVQKAKTSIQHTHGSPKKSVPIQSIDVGEETWDLYDEPVVFNQVENSIEHGEDFTLNDSNTQIEEDSFKDVNISFDNSQNFSSVDASNNNSLLPLNNFSSIVPSNLHQQKNIDIKKLKETIFSVLKSSVTEEMTFCSLFNTISEMNCLESLSRSYCFICLLHLANEHDFVLYNNADLTSLVIKKAY